MEHIDAINLSGDEVAAEAEIGSKPTVAVASGSNAAKGKTSRKLKPDTDDTNENGNLVCLCNRCGVKYIAESSHGTGNMLRHGKNCKGLTYKDVGQFILKTGLNGSLGTRATTYKHEEFHELLAIAIAKHNLPLQFVEYGEWGIHTKVISLTLDNASSNEAMVDCLKFDLDLTGDGAYFHDRCCAHILNLIVQDGLKVKVFVDRNRLIKQEPKAIVTKTID
ncbi:hypothetical protein LXL04_020071 [Taraxacum kok-saghyz]